MKSIDSILVSLLLLAACGGIIYGIYGMYWIAKTVSYSLFYEDMVKQTIEQMVKPEALKR